MGAALARSGGGRGGRRRRRGGYVSEINVTPFVDVMLVLLIIFMVAAPLLTAGVEVDLPKTKSKALKTDAEPLSITIRADGSILLQETPVAAEELLPKMQAIAETGYDQRIFIRGDQTADYGKVVEVMAVLQEAGYKNLGLVTDPSQRRAVRDENLVP